MPLYSAPWDCCSEPNESNIHLWLENLYTKFQPIEQARWNEANIDTLCYAGGQQFMRNTLNYNINQNVQNWNFNIVAQPVNMVTGYQRQHRKSLQYIPVAGSSQDYSEELTASTSYASAYRHLGEKFSTACEQSAIAGMVLVQPYLDFTDDPTNGTLDLQVWSYNSFLCDSFARNADFSDSNFVWTQQYISKTEAKNYFPKHASLIQNMSGYGTMTGKFYFLPENYNMSRTDLLVLSNVWFRSTRKKKMLYSRSEDISYDYSLSDEELESLIVNTGLFEVIEVDVPTWKQAVVLNEQLISLHFNPMGFDECPFVPVFWNYDPHMAQYDLRVRSLVRSMRDAQFLFTRRVILNHDISESSINSGWIRRENSIVNEDDLRFAGQGKDIIVKDNGVPLTENIQKVVPNAVPPSDMQLADQLADLIYRTSGVNEELVGMASDAETGIERILKQGAGLVTLQKYFDQWDVSFKLVGILYQKIIQNWWSAKKIQNIIGKEPSPEWENRIFSRFDVLVEEGLETAVQKQMQFNQVLQLNQLIGGIIPPKYILQISTIQGKNEIIEAIEQQQMQQAQMAEQENILKHALLEAQVQNLHAKSVSEVATARERHGRAESNIGLFEERLSEIARNQNLALKDKMEATSKLLEMITTYGPLTVKKAETKIDSEEKDEEIGRSADKLSAKATSDSNNFMTNLMQQNQPQGSMGQTAQGVAA